MPIDRRELKDKAKKTVKSHYLMFVAALLLCALMGISYNYSTYIFTLLKGGNAETYNSVAADISDSAYINEAGDVVINNNLADSSNDLAEYIAEVIIDRSAAAQIVEHAIDGDYVPEADEKVGIVTLSYQNGILASAINNIKSGSILLTISGSIHKVIKSPRLTAILTLIVGIIILLAYRIFIRNTIWISTKRVFMEAQNYSSSDPKTYLFLLKKNSFFHAAWAYFVKRLYQLLWSITIVGGVIKFFSYAMVPYIIAENPTLKPCDAITLSRKMMDGHKWEMCKLYLSFFGWEVINIMSVGLLGLFFLNPYIESTLAGYYLKLRQIAIETEIEGYELLTDKFIDSYPTDEDLGPIYAGLVAECKQRMSEPIEGYSGVLGFFANTFGMVLSYNDKVKKINQREEDEILLERYNLILEGKLYPSRLHPSAMTRAKAPKLITLHYLKKYSLTSLVSMFFIGAFIGWVYEVAIHVVRDGVFVNRGVLHGPWLPIYGSGAALVLIILYKFRDKPWLEFIMAVVVCGVVEYMTSWVLEITQGQKWWDYTGYFLNINGRVCAEGLLVFGVAGIVFVYFAAPIIDGFLSRINLRVLLPIVVALAIIFITDVVYSHSHPNTGKGITDYGYVSVDRRLCA